MKGKIICVTGATGSYGSKFVELALKKRPRKIIIFSRDEHKQVEMERRLGDNKKLEFYLGDIRNCDSLYRCFSDYGPVDYCVHAAALKHVDKCERMPFEAVQTNLLGAQNIIDVCKRTGVGKVLAISTDKAVNPINTYGSVKLAADKLFLNANGNSTIFAVIRYGNFLNSRGSVVPLFRQLKKNDSEYVPLTHTEMTRFFIPIETAVERGFEALNMMRGGEIFCPKMRSMAIKNLADATGLPVRVIGLRQGEKLHEDLVLPSDASMTREYRRFFVVHTRGGGRGNKVPADFSYNSKNNSKWMETQDLKKFFEG